MTTAILQIENDDNHLSQPEWAEFILEINKIVEKCDVQRSFTGFSNSDDPCLNACWIVEVEDETSWLEWFLSDLSYLAKEYKHDSIALTLGSTRFITSKDSGL